jgi:hypothetical protein
MRQIPAERPQTLTDVLRVCIQRLQILLILKVDGEWIVSGLGTATGSIVVSSPARLLAVLFAVESEGAHSEDGLRLGVDPEVD